MFSCFRLSLNKAYDNRDDIWTYHSADYIFWSFGITEFILSSLENKVLLKPVLGVWPVLHISLPVMNRLNTTESAIFISFVYSLLPKDLTIQDVLICSLEVVPGQRWLCCGSLMGCDCPLDTCYLLDSCLMLRSCFPWAVSRGGAASGCWTVSRR